MSHVWCSIVDLLVTMRKIMVMCRTHSFCTDVVCPHHCNMVVVALVSNDVEQQPLYHPYACFLTEDINTCLLLTRVFYLNHVVFSWYDHHYTICIDDQARSVFCVLVCLHAFILQLRMRSANAHGLFHPPCLVLRDSVCCCCCSCVSHSWGMIS